MTTIHADVETRSPVDLRTAGAFVYFDHPDTSVLMLAYRIGDAPIKVWTFDQPCPPDLADAIRSGAEIVAHNAQFETLAFDWLAKNRGWPQPAYDRYRCTAAMAAAMGLPRSLDKLGEALGLTAQKDKDGSRLIRKFSMPRRPKGKEPDGLYWNEPHDHPEDWQRFIAYCVRDVETEEEAERRMVPLSDFEQRIWLLDQEINRRGIRIDVASANAAVRLAEKAKTKLDREMRLATGGYVGKCSEPGKLLEWVQSQGVELTSAAKAEITDLLECDDLPANVRRALEIRQEAAKTSVAKLNAMLARASADGRVRGSFLYHGASTGRWSNTGVNFANMPRPRRIFDDTKPRTDILFDAIRREDPDLLSFLYGPELGRPLHLLSDAIRGFVWAAPGHDLVQADYAGIEGAVIAWLADEQWKLAEMFKIIADPSIPDLYRQTAAAIMNMTTEVITKKHPLRQSVGKVSELACFTAETQVLTQRGPVSIVEVLPTDKLWDGLQWVTHQGVISKGVRPVVDVDGIGVTPDHLIRTGATWTEASRLASDPSTLARALVTGSESLKSLATATGLEEGCVPLLSSAHVGQNRTRSLWRTSGKVRRPAAGIAPNVQHKRLGNRTSATMMSFLMRRTDADFSTASPRAYNVARTLPTEGTSTTAVEAFQYIGAAIAERFWSIWSRCRDGMTPIWNSTGSTLKRATRREIFGSSRERSTPATGERRDVCKNGSTHWSEKSKNCAPVFDILQAGPRNRFTIFSNSGALVVHNCGFAGGVAAFYAMARAYNVNLDALYGPVWEQADDERREKAEARYETCLKLKQAKADVLSREAWIACEIIKLGWRAANPAIAASWSNLEKAVREAVQNPGTITQAARVQYIAAKSFLWAKLPSGRCLAYGMPRVTDQVWVDRKINQEWVNAGAMDRTEAERLEVKGEVRINGASTPKVTALGVNSVTKAWERFALYGGIIQENNTQATARDLLVNGMLKAEAAGYPVIATVYDEIICERRCGEADIRAFERLICELPAWAEGIPLTAEGWVGKRYRKD